ncbi:GGDEF domain-containing protein [Methylobacterium radiotolerans]|nr:GGDEF domain-containing protein [Methylobacterium radiotolerans]
MVLYYQDAIHMQQKITNWIGRQLDIEHARDGKAERFALRITCQAMIAACIVNAIVHCAIDYVGLLPYPLGAALIVGFATTVSITFVVSLIFTLVIGEAIRALAIQRDAFEHLSSIDVLSGVFNRRAFFERFEGTAEAGQMVLIDIDRFKAINDTYGHLVGDEVIRGVGQILRTVFAGVPAVIGRIGGEEFAVFIPETDSVQADSAEIARVSVAAMIVEGIERPITISLGVAASKPPRSTIEVYSAADRALYLAKAGGRNRVVYEAEICVLPSLQCVPLTERGAKTNLRSETA